MLLKTDAHNRQRLAMPAFAAFGYPLNGHSGTVQDGFVGAIVGAMFWV
jgi:hypothetical protein